MKKILFVISLFAMLFLLGCSEAMEYTTTIVMNNNNNSIIYYDFDDLEFSGLLEGDLLYYITDETEDFKLMLEVLIKNNYIDSLLEADNGVLDTLGEISLASQVNISDMLSYSATELNELAGASGITLTVDDIVGYMDLLNIKEEFPQRITIRRIDYLEMRIGRDLSADEEAGFNDLQAGFERLYAYSEYDVFSKSFLEIIDDLDAVETTYIQAELDYMEIVFDLLLGLTE
ncbi:MAG: hypothetical protein JEZ05_03540 [Tenericutes bacterium]|nr:hypothetical protein [Mycoplasmatota bacterium]